MIEKYKVLSRQAKKRKGVDILSPSFGKSQIDDFTGFIIIEFHNHNVSP